MEERKLYLDYAATTPVKKEVLDEMMPFFMEDFGNASTVYSFGKKAKNAVVKARKQVADLIGATPEEIYFTAGGSESDNWALKGIAFENKKKGNHIITSKIEHHAILHTCEYLEKYHGFEVTYLDVDENGKIDLNELESSIKDSTILITIMFANNEIGTIEPIKEIGEIAKKHNVIFHTDGVQAAGNIEINVSDLNVDLLSMSAHKIYGPKGIGALYIKKGVKIQNLIHGGAQERKKRAGTENTAGIVGYGKACELARLGMKEHIKKSMYLRDKLIKNIIEKIPKTKLNGHKTDRLPGNVNFAFEYIEGEGMLLLLDFFGIAASSGSACTSGSLDPSHVLLSIGLPHEKAHGSLRISIGDFTTEDDIDYVIEHLPGIVQKLRDMSPLYDKAVREGQV